jgi:hypothetical protein
MKATMHHCKFCNSIEWERYDNQGILVDQQGNAIDKDSLNIIKLDDVSICKDCYQAFTTIIQDILDSSNN